MASDDISSTSVTLSKRPISRKHRILSNSQLTRESLVDDSRISRTMTATNRSSSKFPNLLAKDSIYSSRPETMQFKRHRSQEKDLRTASPSKLERQSTTINFQTRAPTLYSLTTDHDHHGICELRRRQIYALNHLMRELEQEQFHQFCKLRGTGTNNHENTFNNNEDTNKGSPT